MYTILFALACTFADVRLPATLVDSPPVPIEQTDANTGRIGGARYQDLGRPWLPTGKNVGRAGSEWQSSAYSFFWTGARSIRGTCIAHVKASAVGPVVAVEESMLECAARDDDWALDVDARGRQVVGSLVIRKGAPVPVEGVFELQNGYGSSQLIGYALGPNGALSMLDSPHVWYLNGAGAEERDAIGAAAVALIRWSDTQATMLDVLAVD